MKKEVQKCEIVQSGDPVLRATAKTVAQSDFGTKALQEIIDSMGSALLAESDGVAIAAPQIGVSLAIFLVSPKAFMLDMEGRVVAPKRLKSSESTQNENMVCINPEIIKTSRKKVKVPEGCLSVRWLYGNTMRHEKAMIRAYDVNGKMFTYGGSGLVAQIFQHETDHLNGILFIDHATEIEELTPKEVEEIKARNQKA